jgi:pyruvate dehydrogenase E1 component alpha subunit
MRARTGEGPSLIEAWTYKLLGHSVIDPGWYRPKEEVEHWQTYEPIRLYREELERSGVLDAKCASEIEVEIDHEIAEAARFAQDSPPMAPEKFFLEFLSKE